MARQTAAKKKSQKGVNGNLKPHSNGGHGKNIEKLHD
jgi:hypothetical protein